MRDAVATTGWTSAHEHQLSDAEYASEQRLRAVDAEVGALGSRHHGSEPPEARAVPLHVRYARGARRRLTATPLWPFAKRVGRRIERERWRVQHRRASRHSFPADLGSIAVVPMPATAEDGNTLLRSTRASHLVFVRPGSELSASGAHAIKRAVENDPGIAFVYGDSRRPDGIRFRAPAFSPLRLREQDYLGPVVALSVAALRERGGFSLRSGSAYLLDFALRIEPSAVRRLREVIGVGQAIDRPSGEAADAANSVVREFLSDIGIIARLRSKGGLRTIDYAVSGEPLVSIIIPTRGSSGVVAGASRTFVLEAVRGIVERSTWRNLEIVVVADDVAPQDVIDELLAIAGERLVLLRWSEPFNFSAKMNRGVAVARGEYLLMLNDDIDIVNADWIERMLGLAQQDRIGMVGAMLYFEDGAIQHLGHIYQGGGAGHVGFGITPGALAPIADLSVTREVSGVTAACALLPADVVHEVGGFSLEFPGNYNDVDLSLKVRAAGWSIVCSGAARLYHFESRTRDAKVLPSEFSALARRWHSMVERDEYSRELEH